MVLNKFRLIELNSTNIFYYRAVQLDICLTEFYSGPSNNSHICTQWHFIFMFSRICLEQGLWLEYKAMYYPFYPKFHPTKLK